MSQALTMVTYFAIGITISSTSYLLGYRDGRHRLGSVIASRAQQYIDRHTS